MNKRIRNFLVALSIVLPASCAPSPAYPAGPQSMVYESPEVTVRLFPEPCDTAKVTMPPGFPSAYRAKVLWRGQDYEACWFVASPSLVGVIDSEGDGGVLPTSMFKPDEGV